MVEFLSSLYADGGRFGVIATVRSTLGNFTRYPHGQRLCPLQTIRDYVTRHTLLAPKIDEFFITHRKPYYLASKEKTQDNDVEYFINPKNSSALPIFS